MEHTVRAPCAGRVAELHSFPGAQVGVGPCYSRVRKLYGDTSPGVVALVQSCRASRTRRWALMLITCVCVGGWVGCTHTCYHSPTTPCCPFCRWRTGRCWWWLPRPRRLRPPHSVCHSAACAAQRLQQRVPPRPRRPRPRHNVCHKTALATQCLAARGVPQRSAHGTVLAAKGAAQRSACSRGCSTAAQR